MLYSHNCRTSINCSYICIGGTNIRWKCKNKTLQDILLECPRTSFRDVLRVNVTERVWISPPPCHPPHPCQPRRPRHPRQPPHQPFLLIMSYFCFHPIWDEYNCTFVKFFKHLQTFTFGEFFLEQRKVELMFWAARRQLRETVFVIKAHTRTFANKRYRHHLLRGQLF